MSARPLTTVHQGSGLGLPTRRQGCTGEGQGGTRRVFWLAISMPIRFSEMDLSSLTVACRLSETATAIPLPDLMERLVALA